VALHNVYDYRWLEIIIMGSHYTVQHEIDYNVLDKMDKDIILDYVWDNMDMMDKIREWIKDVYED
jgi:DNA-binding protein YbaB